MKQPRNDVTRAQEQGRRDANRDKIRAQARAAHAARREADPQKERMRWRKSAGILGLPDNEPGQRTRKGHTL